MNGDTLKDPTVTCLSTKWRGLGALESFFKMGPIHSWHIDKISSQYKQITRVIYMDISANTYLVHVVVLQQAILSLICSNSLKRKRLHNVKQRKSRQ